MKNSEMRKFIAVCVLGVLAGCASTERVPADEPIGAESIQLTSDFSRSKLIAADFVATMTQIPKIDPTTTIFHTEKPATRFGELLLSALQKAGFDLRIGTQESEFWLAYNAVRDNQLSEAGNPVYTFIVAAGEVKLKRSYEVDQYGVSPAGSMFVRGASTADVVMDDSIFSIRKPVINSDSVPRPAPESNPTMAVLNNDVVRINAVPTPKPFVKTRKVTPKVDRNSQQLSELEIPMTPSTSLNRENNAGEYSEFTNMYETRESRYKSILNDYTVLRTNVLVFANDSLILGDRNKATVRQYANDFNPVTDVMSVIGCSHGTTKLSDNGNAYLAIGRAFRVKEEFVAAGFEPQQVLEEGCWANKHFSKMPARGVLVQHRRLSALAAN